MSRKLPRKKPPSQRSERLQREPSYDYDENDVNFIAIHEAGHAVSAVVLGIKLISVDIHRRPTQDGSTSMGFTKVQTVTLTEVSGKGAAAVMPHLVQCMAGPLAEMQVNPDCLEYGVHQGDKEAARLLAAGSVCALSTLEDGGEGFSVEELTRNQEKIGSLIDASCEAAGRLVKEHWEAIQIVAGMLIKRRSLTGEQVAAIVNLPPGSLS